MIKQGYLKAIQDISQDFAGVDPTSLRGSLYCEAVYVGCDDLNMGEMYSRFLAVLGLPYGGTYQPSFFDDLSFTVSYSDYNFSPLMDLMSRWYEDGIVKYGKKRGDEISYDLAFSPYPVGDFQISTADLKPFFTLAFDEDTRKVMPWQLDQNIPKIKRRYKYYLDHIDSDPLPGFPTPPTYEEFCQAIKDGLVDLSIVD